MPHIDLNCDLGESFGAYTIGMDEKVIPFITSANVACGFHAGDPLVMQRTVTLCRTAIPHASSDSCTRALPSKRKVTHSSKVWAPRDL